MNPLRKSVLTIGGLVLLSSGLASTWLTAGFIASEVPSIGCEDLFDRFHPEWHWQPSNPWLPCFGQCNRPFL